VADLFISGIQDQVGKTSQRVISPGLEFDIEFCGAVAHLGRAHGVAAKLLDDFGDFPCRDALDVHLGQGEQQSLFAAGAFFQRAGIKIHAIANLRNTELNGSDTGGQRLGFEAIGAAQALLTTLVGAGLKDGGALLHHGFVDKQAQALGKARGALGGEKLQNGGQKIRVNLVGHVWVFVGCVWIHPNRDHTGPLPASLAREPHPGPAAFGSLRSPSLRRPRMGRSGVKSNYRRTFTPPALPR